MKSRGNHSYIDTYDGRPLDSPWSACVADVCPVGALTTKEFRFQARPWEMKQVATACGGCSLHCAAHAWWKGDEIVRMTQHDLDRMLFDDILYGDRAREEFGRFRRVLQLLGV